MSTLKGKIALVTGGSRGAGRGIAIELAKTGATVYVTGRGNHSHPYQKFGTLETTIAEIEKQGGKGIAITCDHTHDQETKSVMEQIESEQGRIDILVNNVWGGNELSIDSLPFWELPLQHWDTMFLAGVRAQLITNYYALPLMRKQESGLIVHTTFWDHWKYTGNFYYDLAKNALVRMAFGLAEDLKEDPITVLAVSPGWMRTELVLDAFHTDEEHWTEVKELARTESIYYIGRAIVALASDTQVYKKSGQVLLVGDLAREYDFTDLDGRYIPPFHL
jgi:NAD(P)-dependent dehydrogenase (short-subunit alcohol dehydrogenase family)